MKVGFLQFAPEFGNKAANLERIRRWVLEGPSLDVLVLPELATTGYLFLSPEEVAQEAEPIPEGPSSQLFLDLARQRDLALVVGLAERADHRVYNSAAAYLPDGTTVVYRKVHLFWNEKNLFTPGDLGFPVWTFRNARFGLMICFDWYFPEAARSLALQGAEILLHPANLVLPWGQTGMQYRALENRVFTVTANRTGEERRGGQHLKYTGGSQIVAPNGDVLLRVGRETEGIFFVDLDPTAARDKQITPRNHPLEDLRPDQYRLP